MSIVLSAVTPPFKWYFAIKSALPSVCISVWCSLQRLDSVKLYFGLALYKANSDADDGTWKSSQDILARQILSGRELGADGFFFYSWEYLSADQTAQEVANVMSVLQGESA